MQAEMLDSATSCIPSTLNFACDVDGVHTEIPIPSSAWDVENETVWLTQAQLAEVYRSSVQNVGQHIGNILEDEELQADSTIKEFFIVQTEGNREVSRRVTHYNLEMLIALGYRIRSKVATKFRQWATKHLKELMTKGRTELQPMSDAEIMSRALEIAHRTLEAREERIKALTAERDEAIRTKTQYQSNLASQMSGRVGGLTSALNRARTENAELKEENVTLKDGWWSVSDVTRMIARVCKLPRVYAVGTLSSKCRIGLRYFAAKRNRMTRMLEVDGTHQDKYGNLVQNTAEHFDDDTVADFRQWVDENPDLFSKIQSILVITMNDEKPSN